MNEEMYRVTTQYKSVKMDVTTTVSMRVQAYSHTLATEISEEIVRVHILADRDDWMLMKLVVQNQDQIDDGEG